MLYGIWSTKKQTFRTPMATGYILLTAGLSEWISSTVKVSRNSLRIL